MDDRVSVIDTDRLDVIPTIEVGERRRRITFSKDFSKLYVYASDVDTVQMFDPNTGKIGHDFPSREDPGPFVLHPDDMHLCMANEDDAITAAVIATPTGAETACEGVKMHAGETPFEAECHHCHAMNAQDPSYGPWLANIINRPAGRGEGCACSEAQATSGIAWLPAALRAWMEDNAGFMLGTKMRRVGITDLTVQDVILSRLASLT